MIQNLSRLLSLSTEVLLIVLGHLHSTALLIVSKVSRRLHYLAIPIYLLRYRVHSPVPASLVLQKKTIFALPGLIESLSITSLDSLTCKFEGPDETNFTWGTVTLNMGNIDARWIDGLATATSDKWKPLFIYLLNTILERQCASLTITHGHFIVLQSRELGDPTSIPAVVSPISNRTLFSRFKFPPSRSKPLPADALPLRKALHSFSIHSNMLLSKPFYDWTLHILNTSAIVDLSISLSAFRLDTWTIILQAITIPTLAVFTVETIDISFPDLILFLSRHSSITTLNLHPHFTYPETKSRLKRPKKKHLLPQLAVIGGNPVNIAAIISHLHSDTAHRLHTLSLTLPTHQRVFQPSDFESLVASIVGAVQDAVTLTGLSIRCSVPSNTSFPLASRNRENSSTGAMRKAVFHSVETLTFSTDGHFAFAQWVIPVLPAWLAKFVRLQHVCLAQDCVPSDVDARVRFVELIKASCSRVRTVTLGEEVQTLK